MSEHIYIIKHLCNMRKLLVVALAVVALASCKNENPAQGLADINQVDSLQRIIVQKDNEINDIMGTFNDINEGFRQITEAEGRVAVAQSGEGASQSQKIREDITFISQRMQQNKQLIAKLQQQLRESSYKGDELKKIVESMIAQLEEKEQQLQQLRSELDSKDIHISQLDEAINNLNNDVKELAEDNTKKANEISDQDKQLNTAWYVFGTKNELKQENILVKGKVLQENFNKNYFTKIDIRVVKEIKLYSKSAQLLTTHPSGSYTLTRDAKEQFVLHITDPKTFWSTSKYLVVQVK